MYYVYVRYVICAHTYIYVYVVTPTHLQVPVDVAEHVDRRLDEQAARLVLEDGPRPRAEPQHVPRELDRGEVGGVLLRRLLSRACASLRQYVCV